MNMYARSMPFLLTTQIFRVNLVIELKRFHSFAPFNDLAPELKTYLLKFLDVPDLCALSQTCNDMKVMTYGADSEWTLPRAVCV
jgi:hypothetical protein